VTASLLDTSAYSAFLRGHEELKLALQRADRIVLTPVVLGELGAGFRAGARLKKNEAELRRFLASPRVEVVPIDAETAERYAVILHGLRQAGTPIPTNDIWIAASAMQHGLRVLTTDVHYTRMPQIIVGRIDTG
jgi:predicted nucleic acid-binding protein